MVKAIFLVFLDIDPRRAIDSLCDGERRAFNKRADPMTFVPGTRLGPFEIVSFLGAGGMGKVYRTRDTQLKREVAIKVLPPEVAADADRLALFQREAELLAALPEAPGAD